MAIALPPSHAPRMDSASSSVGVAQHFQGESALTNSTSPAATSASSVPTNSPLLPFLGIPQSNAAVNAIKWPYLFGVDNSSEAIAVDSLNPPKKPRKPRKSAVGKKPLAPTMLPQPLVPSLSTNTNNQIHLNRQPAKISTAIDGNGQVDYNDSLIDKYQWIQMADGNSYLVSTCPTLPLSHILSPPNSPSSSRPNSPVTSVTTTVDVDLTDLPAGLHSDDNEDRCATIDSSNTESTATTDIVSKRPVVAHRKKRLRIKLKCENNNSGSNNSIMPPKLAIDTSTSLLGNKAHDTQPQQPIIITYPVAGGSGLLVGDLLYDLNLNNVNTVEDEGKVLKKEVDPYLIPPKSASTIDIQAFNWESEADTCHSVDDCASTASSISTIDINNSNVNNYNNNNLTSDRFDWKSSGVELVEAEEYDTIFQQFMK